MAHLVQRFRPRLASHLDNYVPFYLFSNVGTLAQYSTEPLASRVNSKESSSASFTSPVSPPSSLLIPEPKPQQPKRSNRFESTDSKAEPRFKPRYGAYVVEVRNLPTIHRFGYDPYFLLECVKESFKRFGPVKTVSIYRDRTGQISTRCYVYFSDPEDVGRVKKYSVHHHGVPLHHVDRSVLAYPVYYPAHTSLGEAGLTKGKPRVDKTRILFHDWQAPKTTLWRWVAEAVGGQPLVEPIMFKSWTSARQDLLPQEEEVDEDELDSVNPHFVKYHPKERNLPSVPWGYMERREILFRRVEILRRIMRRRDAIARKNLLSSSLDVDENGFAYHEEGEELSADEKAAASWAGTAPLENIEEQEFQEEYSLDRVDDQEQSTTSPSNHDEPPNRKQEQKVIDPLETYELDGIVDGISFTPQTPINFPILSLYPTITPRQHGVISLRSPSRLPIDPDTVLNYLREKDLQICGGINFRFVLPEIDNDIQASAAAARRVRRNRPGPPPVLTIPERTRKMWLEQAVR